MVTFNFQRKTDDDYPRRDCTFLFTLPFPMRGMKGESSLQILSEGFFHHLKHSMTLKTGCSITSERCSSFCLRGSAARGLRNDILLPVTCAVVLEISFGLIFYVKLEFKCHPYFFYPVFSRYMYFCKNQIGDSYQAASANDEIIKTKPRTNNMDEHAVQCVIQLNKKKIT